MKPIPFFWQIAMCCLHELCHVLMAYAMYPFGTRIKSTKINWHETGEGESSMCVGVSHEGSITCMLVCIAPLVFYYIALLAGVLCSHFLIVFVLLRNHKYFQLSRSDKDVAKCAWLVLVKNISLTPKN